MWQKTPTKPTLVCLWYRDNCKPEVVFNYSVSTPSNPTKQSRWEDKSVFFNAYLYSFQGEKCGLLQFLHFTNSFLRQGKQWSRSMPTSSHKFLPAPYINQKHLGKLLGFAFLFTLHNVHCPAMTSKINLNRWFLLLHGHFTVVSELESLFQHKRHHN